MRSRRGILVIQLVILAALLALWEWGTQVAWLAKHVKILDPFFISTPSRIVHRFFELSAGGAGTTLWDRILTTVLHTLGGFAAGGAAGSSVQKNHPTVGRIASGATVEREVGYEIAQKREALENVLIPYKLLENRELLLRTGFKYVDVFFKWYNFTGLVAVK